VGIQEEGLSGGFSSWDDQVAEEALIITVEALHSLSPVDESGSDWVKEVIKALKITFVFELFT
jgi:hypothetical protein